MAHISPSSFNSMSLPMPIQRMNALPLDATELFDTLAKAKAYASSSATAYVGQIIRVVDSTSGEVQVYIITGTGTLTRLAFGSDVDSAKETLSSALKAAGFQGPLSTLMQQIKEGKTIPIGAEYVVATPEEIRLFPALANELEVGDYIVATAEINKADKVNASTVVVLQRNLVDALTSITGGDSENGKYISAIRQDGSTLLVTKTALPNATLKCCTVQGLDLKQSPEGKTYLPLKDKANAVAHGTVFITLNGIGMNEADDYEVANNGETIYFTYPEEIIATDILNIYFV